MAVTAKPNIILINCDDLGYGDLGCYGSDHHATPNLDRMAGEGMKFNEFYMASPVCSPSRGAMMTGCYPPRIGFGKFEGMIVLFPGQGIGLSTEENTVASLLKEQGYATKLVGKWHCGDQPEFLPTRHGFDGYYGLPYSNDMGRQATKDGSVGNSPPCPCCATKRSSRPSPTRPDSPNDTPKNASDSSATTRTGRSSSTSPTCTFMSRCTSPSDS